MVLSEPWVVKKKFVADRKNPDLFYDVEDTSKVYTIDDINQLKWRYQAVTQLTHTIFPAERGGLQIAALH